MPAPIREYPRVQVALTRYRQYRGRSPFEGAPSRPQIIKGGLLHTFYWIKDYLVPLENAHLILQAATSKGESVSSPFELPAVNGAGNGQVKKVYIMELANAILETLRSPKAYDYEEIAQNLQGHFGERISESDYRSAIHILRMRKKITIAENGLTIKKHSQFAAISKLAVALQEELAGVSTLHRLADKVEAVVGKKITANAHFYFKTPSGEIMIFSGRHKEKSSFHTWKVERSGGMFSVMDAQVDALPPEAVEIFEYVRDIRQVASADGPVFPEDVEKYGGIYELGPNPEMLYSIMPVGEPTQRKVAVIAKFTEWPLKDGGRAPVFYADVDPGKRNLVNLAIRQVLLVIANRVGDITTASQPGMSLQDIWQTEEDMIKEEAVRNIGEIERGDAEQQTLSEIIESKSRLRRNGIFQIAKVPSPRATLNENQRRVLAVSLDWYSRGIEDMLGHIDPATELIPVLYRGEGVAFGAGVELPLVNEGRKETLALMIGTMSKPGYKGYGMQTVVNGIFMLGLRLKHFSKAPVAMMRTRQLIPAVGFLRHFSSVKWKALEGRALNRARAFCGHVGGKCDENGVVKNAYEVPLKTDEARDAKILESLRKKDPKIYKIVTEAFAGLSEHDARVFQGKLTWWKAVKFWLYVHIYYGLFKNRKLLKEE